MSNPPPPRVPNFSDKQYSKDVGLSYVVFLPFEINFAVAKSDFFNCQYTLEILCKFCSLG